MVKEHTCSGLMDTVHQLPAHSDWVAKKINDRFIDQSKIRVKDIVKDPQRDHGVRFSYMQAWRGKDVAKEMIDGSHERQYHDLPLYMDRIQRTNSGIEIRIHIDEGKFK
ncbi:hypothetical protein AMTR_s00010p00258430 [Amborella trichopoda]|uniref:Uncharacterized protein n=1 Tax=Amborella trichopoda TaxID=13333 RepID=W1NF55_AMBTC|nr:hypothetical protein AMTR_s00010p00258430 [Amborella trichopoda]